MLYGFLLKASPYIFEKFGVSSQRDAMNSFALLQDDVEDVAEVKAESVAPKKLEEAPVPAVDVLDAVTTDDKRQASGDGEAEPNGTQEEGEGGEGDAQKKPVKEKEMSLEEYMAKKATLSSGLESLSKGGPRKANDGRDGFAKMSVLKKAEEPEDTSIMGNVAVKEVQESKGLKDSTHAAVARNAEIQKFFQRDPGDKRRNDGRRGYGDRRGRGGKDVRGGRGRGEVRGRGGYRGGHRGGQGRDIGEQKAVNSNSSVIVPSMDDTSAFPSL